LPEILAQAAVGDRVFIDDGSIGCVVSEKRPDGLLLTVRETRKKGEKLRADKGLNFPDSALTVGPLTAEDLAALDELANEVDMFGFSFVKTADDVERLRAEITRRRDPKLPPCAIMLKIETALGLQNLPELIVRSAGAVPTCVMIARGDLAVEIGYQRLAEIQEEMLWLCEAANIPVIWATAALDVVLTRTAQLVSGRLAR
jgi:pyruvate kinase